MAGTDSKEVPGAEGPTRAPSAGWKYVPALDGMRGLAILLVMAYHAFPRHLHGGFLGVELFFVLSGFLITSLLLQEWDRYGSISLPCFYMRRIIRLLPALLVLIVGVALVERSLLASFVSRSSTLKNTAFACGYVMNWARAYGWSDGSLLGHTWSLSIEEQFYLLWPAVLLLLCHRVPASQLARCLLLMSVAAAAYRFALAVSGATPMRLYNGLDTRADGLILGSALAAALQPGTAPATFDAVKRRISGAWPWAAAGLVLAVGLADWRLSAAYTLLLPLTVICSTCLVGCVYVSPPDSGLRRFFEGRMLVRAGQISYGLYLWHYPVYRMLSLWEWSPAATAILGTGLSFGLALLSERWVERPVRQWKASFSPEAARAKAAGRATVGVSAAPRRLNPDS